MRLFFCAIIFLRSCAAVCGQDSSGIQQQFNLHIKKSSSAIKIDGDLEDAAWKDAETTTPFFLKFPTDEGVPKRKTEVKTLYNDQYVYFAFTAYDSGSNHFIRSLKRDVGHDDNDGVAVILDPVNQHSNGFFFVVNAFNVQSEDVLSSFGGNDGVDFSWDNKWLSATKIYEDRWTAEIAIPFKTLRYTAGKMNWGINFLRVDAKSNEYSTWTKVPRNFRSYDLGYTGLLQWDAAPPAPGKNISLIPYITGNITDDKAGNAATKITGNAGLDAKIALTSSLNLDLTVNPDFSQIEVDRQVTNLTRYNIFFPERRTFFLENSDLFSSYGIPPIRPFYSRRIGLDNNGNRLPILFGARLTGNIAGRTRVGIMNMETGKKNGSAAQNYSAVSINQGVLKRSMIKGYFLNHSASLSAEEIRKDPLQKYGRNTGIEFDYTNQKGTWNGWGTFNHSLKPGITKNNIYSNTGFSYSGRNIGFTVDATTLGTNYYTDMGYVERIENYDAARDTSIRVGFKHLFTQAEYKIFPKKGRISQHSIQAERYYVINPDNTFNEADYSLNYSIMFHNSSNLFVIINANKVKLLFPVSFTGKTPLPINTYNYQNAGVGYESDRRKLLSFTIEAIAGTFYNGTNIQLSTGFTIHSQPHLDISLQAEYNKLHFPAPYGEAELFLLAPRVDFNFSTKIFWTTFLQYNTQQNNFNINSRLQWRYKPMSDLFLVYTDNYFSDPLLKNKNRSFVFKLSYWL
jgi:Domain of unknown function (DUF5916)/Carbohydrate family 9 binding domain-like